MKEINLTIADPVGLYGKPANICAAAANRYISEITMVYEDKEIDMKSILSIMYLAVPSGSPIKIKTEGEDEDIAIAGIKEVLEEFNIAK